MHSIYSEAHPCESHCPQNLVRHSFILYEYMKKEFTPFQILDMIFLSCEIEKVVTISNLIDTAYRKQLAFGKKMYFAEM